MRHLLCALLLLSTACTAEEPDSGGGRVLAPDAGMPEAPPDEELGVHFQVDGLPPQTYWDTVPVFGQGPANGTVIIEGNVETISVELSSDGSFCTDVRLESGALNALEMVAIDEFGERSDTQSFDVSQSGEPPEAGEPVAARNVLLGGLPTPDSTIIESVGSFSAMTDNNMNTSVTLRNDTWDKDWFVLRVPAADGVESIKVTSSRECGNTNWGTGIGDYGIYTAPAVVPNMGRPGEGADSPWTQRGHYEADGTSVNVTDCSTTEYSCQEFQFDAAVSGAIGIDFLGNSCSNFWEVGIHKVHQIEAWSPEGVAPPSIKAPSCAGGF